MTEKERKKSLLTDAEERLLREYEEERRRARALMERQVENEVQAEVRQQLKKKFIEEEEKLVNEYEVRGAKGALKPVPEAAPSAGHGQVREHGIGIENLRKTIEKEIKQKLESRLREEIEIDVKSRHEDDTKARIEEAKTLHEREIKRGMEEESRKKLELAKKDMEEDAKRRIEEATEKKVAVETTRIEAEVKQRITREASDKIKEITRRIKEEAGVRLGEEIGRQVEEAKLRLEQEAKENVEAAHRARVEDAKKQFEKEIRVKIEAEAKERVEDAKTQIEEAQKFLDITAIKEKLREELRAEMQENEKKKQEEMLGKIRQAAEQAKKSRLEQEQSMLEKMKQQISMDMEEEKEKKKKEMLQKLEILKAENAARPEKLSEARLSHEEKAMLAGMFDESMAVISFYFQARTGRGRPDFVKLSVKSLVDAARKEPEYIRKALFDAAGVFRTDGNFDNAKLIALANNISPDEAKRAEKLCSLLKILFEERLIAIEQASNAQIKGKIISDFLFNFKKVTGTNKYTKRIESLFLNYVAPKGA